MAASGTQITIREEEDEDSKKMVGRLEMRVQVAGTAQARGADGRCSDMKQLSGMPPPSPLSNSRSLVLSMSAAAIHHAL